jgi:uncharacterized protein YlaI
MCNVCNERIEEKTNARIATGKFRFYQDKKTEESW